MTDDHSTRETTPPLRQRRAEFYSVVTAVTFIGVFVLAMALTGGHGRLLQLAQAQWGVILGLLGLSGLNYATRAVRWQVFSVGAGVRVPLLRNALYFVSGFSMMVTPGKVGEVLRLWLLRRHYGYGYTQTTPILVADRLSDLAAILLLSFAGVSAFSGFLPVLAAILVVTVAIVLLLVRSSPLLRGLQTLQHRVRRLRRPLELMQTTLRQTSQLHSRRLFAITLVLACTGWAFEALGFFWLLQVLGANVNLLQAVFIFAFAMLVGAIAVLPGGLGGTEATMTALLTAAGVELDVAIVATAVIRITTLWFAVVVGFAALVPALRGARPKEARSG
ncbi:MAG: lysylphosphatidylglycerol synthase transmembrane domain-containing protein [Dehalococcoidia bacterium]